jgi:phosphohistidine phosphatase SixA
LEPHDRAGETKRLVLLRHASAAAGASGGAPDRERPLDARGREQAARAGARLAALGWAADLALCSPARRARETLELAPTTGPGAATTGPGAATTGPGAHYGSWCFSRAPFPPGGLTERSLSDLENGP